jgi:hypothetical protein
MLLILDHKPVLTDCSDLTTFLMSNQKTKLHGLTEYLKSKATMAGCPVFLIMHVKIFDESIQMYVDF